MNNNRIPTPPPIPSEAEKIGLVNYAEEIDRTYIGLMKAEYEKANIWPLSDSIKGLAILREEIEEAQDATERLDTAAGSITENFSKAPDCNDLEYIKGNAISAICELLQVIAVCNKYAGTFSKAERVADNETL